MEESCRRTRASRGQRTNSLTCSRRHERPLWAADEGATVRPVRLSRTLGRPGRPLAATVAAAMIVPAMVALATPSAAAPEDDDEYTLLPGEVAVLDPLENDEGNNAQSDTATVKSLPQHGELSVPLEG